MAWNLVVAIPAAVRQARFEKSRLAQNFQRNIMFLLPQTWDILVSMLGQHLTLTFFSQLCAMSYLRQIALCSQGSWNGIWTNMFNDHG